MRKSKHRSKKRKRSRKASTTGPFFLEVDDLYDGLPTDDVVRALAESGRSYERKFEKSFTKLATLIRSGNPLSLVGKLATYGLYKGVADDGGEHPSSPETEIQQAHVELAQALALAVPAGEIKTGAVSPRQVQEIWDLMIEVSDAFHLKRMTSIGRAATEDEMAVLRLQEQLRMHTQFVRNWGYFIRVIEIAIQLYEPVDQLFEAHVGLGATQIIRFFEHLTRRNEAAVNEQWQKLRPVFRARATKDAIAAYYDAFPTIPGSPGQFLKYLDEHQISRDGFISIVLNHQDANLLDVYTFDISVIAEESGLDAEGLRRTLPKLSHKLGELCDETHEFFFLGNPVWNKPLIQIEGDRYFCAIPQSFFSFVFSALNELAFSSPELSQACSARRASFLEQRVAESLSRAFDVRNYAQNATWRAAGVEYETDLIFRVDSFLFIVEAKSGSITWPTLRGAPERVKRHVVELLIEPSRQSKRLADLLMQTQCDDNGAEFINPLPFSLSGIQQIVRLSVTLDDFGTIQSNVSVVEGTGWVEGEHRIAPTLLLADLEIILDLLESIPAKIHYFVRRSEINDHIIYQGDELDLLGLYLANAFNIGPAEFGKKKLVLAKMSQQVDRYYTALDNGFTLRKPTLNISKWWLDIQTHIERRRIGRWSEIAVMLLNISFDDQCKIEKLFKKVAKNVKRKWRRPSYNNSVIIEPPRRRHDGFALVAFRERQKAERHKFMENVASQIFANSEAKRCLVIAVNIDKDQYPYSTLGLYDRP